MGLQLDGTHVLFRFEPRCERVLFAARCDSLASEINRYADGAALHFAAFDGELNIGAAGVPGDDGKFCADSFLEQLGKLVIRVAGAGGAAFRRRRRIANIMDGFIRRRRPHVQQRFRGRGAANPGEFRSTEIGLTLP